MQNENDIFNEYALLDIQEKQIKKQKEEMREKLFKLVSELDGKVETPFGKFSITKGRPTYTYPDSIVKLQEDLEAKKAFAIETGQVKEERTPGLLFTPTKL